MNKQEIKGILEELELHPARKKGQNFLVDTNMRDFLLRTAAPQAGERILEIGAGLGALTMPLAENGCLLTAVEIDERLADFLRERLADFPNSSVICDDACDLDSSDLMGGDDDYRCLANLPYSAATPILMRLIKSDCRPRELYILLQEEVADRLVAECGNKQYGAVTVQTHLLYNTRKLRRLPPTVFYPTPEVNSAFVHLSRRPSRECPDETVYDLACRLAKKVFGQRRKQSLKILKDEYDSERIEQAFQTLAIGKDARAENIPPHLYLNLARLILGDR